MPRPLSFKKSKIIEQATLLFWQKGFQGTSMRDIGLVTRLNPGSLYGCFGNKRSLFMQVLEHYYQQLTKTVNKTLTTAKSNINVLDDFFQIIVTENKRSDVKGCLLVNSLLELADDREMQAHISAMFTGFEEMFYWVIVRGQKQGDYNPRLDARSTAQYLLNNYYGVRVQCMTEIDNDQLSSTIDDFLSRLN